MAGERQATGWGRPDDAHRFHFFVKGARHEYLLESACTYFTNVPWYWDPTIPLDPARYVHADGNCIGCRAWLWVTANGRLRHAA